MTKRILFLASLSMLVLAGSLVRVTRAQEEDRHDELQKKIEFIRVIQNAKEKIFPLIVYLKPVQETYESGKKEMQAVVGSGVIISSEGHVVTNYHVAEKSTEIVAVLFNEKQVNAKLVGMDQDTDIALLKLELDKEDLPLEFAEFADSSKVKEGDFVMTMGCPLGLTRSVSFGIISNSKRFLRGFSKYNLWFQTDAAINPGNSGGPLVNIEGKIVGINTLGSFWYENIGFSIPSNVVKDVVDDMKKHGTVRRSWFGIQLQPLKDFDRNTFFDAEKGVLVGGVEPNSPAEESELLAGDLVLSVNGKMLNGTFIENLPSIRNQLAKLPPEEETSFLVVRKGNRMVVKLTPVIKGRVEGEDYDCEEWQMTVKEINKHRDKILHYFQNEGVYVQGVEGRGNAKLSEFQGLDIIISIEDSEIKSLDDMKKLYEKLDKKPKGERKAAFKVLREGLPHFLVLDYNKKKSEYEEEE